MSEFEKGAAADDHGLQKVSGSYVKVADGQTGLPPPPPPAFDAAPSDPNFSDLCTPGPVSLQVRTTTQHISQTLRNGSL